MCSSTFSGCEGENDTFTYTNDYYESDLPKIGNGLDIRSFLLQGNAPECRARAWHLCAAPRHNTGAELRRLREYECLADIPPGRSLYHITASS
ncbi:hypothetical protein PI125_g7505 [Phytophthora idaei]|nr:hypothetical protein PI125_g7505 [Phytophthora idaei]